MNYKDVNFKVKRQSTRRFVYTFVPLNKKREKLTVELSYCNVSWENSIPYLWYKAGYMEKKIDKYLCINLFVEKDNKYSNGAEYNPTISREIQYDKKGNVISDYYCWDFNWLLESTEENVEKLLNEVVSRFYQKFTTSRIRFVPTEEQKKILSKLAVLNKIDWFFDDYSHRKTINLEDMYCLKDVFDNADKQYFSPDEIIQLEEIFIKVDEKLL